MPAAGSPWPRLGGVKIMLQRAIQLYIDQWFTDTDCKLHMDVSKNCCVNLISMHNTVYYQSNISCNNIPSLHVYIFIIKATRSAIFFSDWHICKFRYQICTICVYGMCIWLTIRV